MTDSTALAERYGRRSRSRTNLVLAVAALAGVARVAVTTWSFLAQADPDVRSTLRAYDVRSEHEEVGDVVLARGDTDLDATGHLHADGQDDSPVGRPPRVVARGAPAAGPTSAPPAAAKPPRAGGRPGRVARSGRARRVMAARIPPERRAGGVVPAGSTSPSPPPPPRPRPLVSNTCPRPLR